MEGVRRRARGGAKRGETDSNSGDKKAVERSSILKHIAGSGSEPDDPAFKVEGETFSSSSPGPGVLLLPNLLPPLHLGDERDVGGHSRVMNI